jgi:spermidine synthase
VLVANVFTYDPRYPDVMDAMETVFAGRTCWFDKVAGNNRIVYALHMPSDAVARRMTALRRRRGFGLGLLNRLAIRSILVWIASRSVLALPHLGATGSRL